MRRFCFGPVEGRDVRTNVDYRLMSDYEVTLVNDNSKSFIDCSPHTTLMLSDGD